MFPETVCFDKCTPSDLNRELPQQSNFTSTVPKLHKQLEGSLEKAFGF
jgi:hypothetical protein